MEIKKIEAIRLDHLGLIAQMADDIFLSESIDKLVGDVGSREIVSIGQAVQAMCINCLSFTIIALHLTPHFFQTRDLKFLLGNNKGRPSVVIKAEHLNEHKLNTFINICVLPTPQPAAMTAFLPKYSCFKHVDMK